MMTQILEKAVYLLNILGLLAIDAYLWTLSWQTGIGGLAGLAGFFIGYSLSGGMTVALRDLWRLPEYEVFRKKLKYANTIAGATIVWVSIILLFIGMAFCS